MGINDTKFDEGLTTKKKDDGNVHNRFACSVYLRVAFISLVVDVGEGVYSRAEFNFIK